MSFLSPGFALFAACALASFHAAPARQRRLVLLAASLAFYAAWSLAHLALLVAVTVAVQACAVRIARAPEERAKRRWLGAAVGAALAILVSFKYGGAALGLASAHGALGWLVPLGLSYYSFKLIGYAVDVYWEKIGPARDTAALLLYASFFPQVVSGPIHRAGDFLAQEEALGRADPADAVGGLRRILLGLFKKMVIADRLAPLVAAVHAAPSSFSSLELLLGAYAFALQLYADFSGVTDIALGLGRLFGVSGPENFDRPFFAASLPEYWRRWHMSLTSWLSDYVFTPLRMALRYHGAAGLCVAIAINMVAVGVWHGAALTYAAFGVIHAALMIVAALTSKRRNAYFRAHPRLARARAVAAPIVTFHLVVLAMIFFRAQSVSSALEYCARIVAHGAAGATRLSWTALDRSPGALAVAIGGLLVVEGVQWATRQPGWARSFVSAPRPLRWALYYAVALAIVFGSVGSQKFIYAQF